jgi:hypothetical protein
LYPAAAGVPLDENHGDSQHARQLRPAASPSTTGTAVGAAARGEGGKQQADGAEEHSLEVQLEMEDEYGEEEGEFQVGAKMSEAY